MLNFLSAIFCYGWDPCILQRSCDLAGSICKQNGQYFKAEKLIGLVLNFSPFIQIHGCVC